MILAEQIASDVNWTLLINGGCLFIYVLMWWDARKTRTQPVLLDGQPVTVELVKALHEQFAAKDVFDKHVVENSERHAQFFRRFDELERSSRRDLTDAVSGINTDRARTMEKLNEQFTFIRESLSAINRELQLTRGDEIP